MWPLLSLSATLSQWFPLPSALAGPGTYWSVWCWIPPICWHHSKGVIPQALVCPFCPVPPQFKLQPCNQEMVVWGHICPSPDTHILKSPLESLPFACDQSDSLFASLVIPKSLCVGGNSLLWPDCLWHIGQQISLLCQLSPLDLAASWSPGSPCYHCQS